MRVREKTSGQTRKKPEAIVRESQKIFGFSRKAFGMAATAFLIFGLWSWTSTAYYKYQDQKRLEAQSDAAALQAAPQAVLRSARTPAAKPVVERRVTAYPGRWSEPVVFPPNAWFRLDPQGKVRVRDLRGKEWDDEPGAARWAGEENVANFAFRFRSRVSEPVEVVVYHHSK